MLKNILLLTVCFSFSIPQAFAVDCPEIIDTENNTQVHQLKLENGVCLVELVNHTLPYPNRAMMWNSQGRLMSFVTFAKGTGARAYYIVPVDSTLKVKGDMKQGSKYEVRASEQNWTMDKKSSTLAIPASCDGAVLPASSKNRGGVEIKSCENKLVIDAGWKMGSSPDLERAGQSTVHDPQGASCAVNNKDIYTYQPGEEPSPKFVTSQDWYDFLKDQPQCKNLNTAFLKQNSRPSGQTSHPPTSGAQ